MGIHTALDTNGYYGDRAERRRARGDRPRAARHQDLGPGAPPRLTGMDIGPTLDFARRLAARKRPVWVRFVLVPGLTDDPEDIAQIAVRRGLGNVERVDVLPFHKGGGKWGGGGRALYWGWVGGS